MASDDVLVGLRLDLANLNREFREASGGAIGVEERYGALLNRMRATKKELGLLEKFEQRVTGRILKQVGRAAIAFGISEVAARVFPDAISPLVTVGTAAAMGAAFGGPQGAALAATMAAMSQVIEGVKGIQQRIEEHKKRIADNANEIRMMNAAIRNERIEREFHGMEFRKQLRQEIDARVDEIATQTWLNTP